jgi:hypothetical protein
MIYTLRVVRKVERKSSFELVVLGKSLERQLFFFIIISGVGLSPLGTAATSGLLYSVQAPDDR